MSAFQINFTLRAPSSKTRSCHLVGSWDSYSVQVPLSRHSGSSGPKFTGSMRFPVAAAGQRYWYYFVVDGHSTTYDPGTPKCIESTTGRTLNILDLKPAPGSRSGGGGDEYRDRAGGGSRRHSRAIANGRALSPSQIQHPHPDRPYATKAFSSREMDALSRRYAAQRLSDIRSNSPPSSSDDDSTNSSRYYSSSRASSGVPSLSSRSSQNSSPSSVSSVGSPISSAQQHSTQWSGCTCERYAITRSGQRVRVDCGGKVCAGSEDGSEDSLSESERERYRRHEKDKGRSHGPRDGHSGSSRRHGGRRR